MKNEDFEFQYPKRMIRSEEVSLLINFDTLFTNISHHYSNDLLRMTKIKIKINLVEIYFHSEERNLKPPYLVVRNRNHLEQ
jgi:hypothetical protein